MTGFVIAILAVLAVLALGIALFMGRGGALIAGYNSLSKTERAKYNEKALFRAMGSFVIALDALVAGAIIAAFCAVIWLVFLLLILTAAAAVAFILWVNKGGRFKK